MELYGLIGKSLQHSFSKDYFQKKFANQKVDADYRFFEMDELIDLHDLFESEPNLKGLNVTIPYKRIVVNQLDELSPIARITGSVNVVKRIDQQGRKTLKGFNTDARAFENSIKPMLKGRKELRALILGSGGAAHSVAYVLRKMGIYFYFVSRKPQKVETMSYSWITPKTMQEYRLIINTTPIGTFPKVSEKPDILYEELTSEHILYDLVYNPPETLFLKEGKTRGAQIKNGYDMLKIQAEESWKIWQSRKNKKNEYNHFWLW
jgi:shikimate dehydrogenase